MTLILFLIALSSSYPLDLIPNTFNVSECCYFENDCENLGNRICDKVLNTSNCGFDFGDCASQSHAFILPINQPKKKSTSNYDFLQESISNSCNFQHLERIFPCNFQLFFFEVKNCSVISGSFEFNSLNQAVLVIDSLIGDLYISGFIEIEKIIIKSLESSRIFFQNVEINSGFDLILRNNKKSEVNNFRVYGKENSFNVDFEIENLSEFEMNFKDGLVRISIENSRVFFSQVLIDNILFDVSASETILDIKNADFFNIKSENLMNIKGKSLVNIENCKILDSTFNKNFVKVENSVLKIRSTVLSSSHLLTSVFESINSFISLENSIIKGYSNGITFANASDSTITASNLKIKDSNMNIFAELINNSKIILKDSEINTCIIQNFNLSAITTEEIPTLSLEKCLNSFIPKKNQDFFSRSLKSENSSEYTKKCQDGQIYLYGLEGINGSACYPCDKGTYVDHSKTEYNTCFVCPKKYSLCENGTFIPKKGYYKFNDPKYSLVIRECPNKAACIGNKSSDFSSTSFVTKCGDNYDGDFCHTCKDDSTKTSLHICSKCPKKVVNILIIIALIIMMSLISYYLIKTTISSAFISQEMYSMGIKIFVNYFQIIYLCLQYKLKWSSLFKTNQDNTDNDESSSGYFFSLKCLLQLNLSEIDMFYLRTYFMNLMPVFLFIGSWIYYFILSRMKNVHNVKLYRTVILIIPFLLVYPSVITYSLAPLACLSLSKGRPKYFDESVDDYHDFLIENRAINCNREHYTKVAAAVLVGVILWGITVPAYIFYQIFKQRKNLFEHDIKFRYGFLFNGYLRNRYYWEFIIFMKKLIIVFLTVFMESEFSSNVQSILVVTILILFLILQIYYKPYFQESLNDLETFGCLTGMVTILCGIIYTETNSGDYIVYFLVLIIFFINISFLLYWLKFMTKEFFDYLIKNYNFLSRFRKDDGFADDISKIFVHVKFLYIKDNQKLYTPIDDEDESEIEKVAYKNSEITQLYTDIVNTGLEKYKNDLGPNPRGFKRRESRFMS